MVGGTALIVLVGGGLLWLLTGFWTAVVAVVVVVGAVALGAALWLLLRLAERWASG